MVQRKYIDCLVLGDCFFDVTVKLAGFQKAIKSGGAMHTEGMSLLPGGAGNIAVAISRVGGVVALCSVVGVDPLGRIYISDLKANRVVPIIQFDNKSPTGMLLSLISRTGERSFLVSRGANDSLKTDHVDKAFAKTDPNVVFISGFSLTRNSMEPIIMHALKLAEKNNSKILFDCTPHNLVRDKRNLFREIISRSYCVCLNYKEALNLVGSRDLNTIIRRLKEFVKLVALKLGRNGCIIAEGSVIKHIEAPRIKVRDTNGAGDIFSASIAFGIARELSTFEAGRMAVNTASYKVQFSGPRLPISDY